MQNILTPLCVFSENVVEHSIFKSCLCTIARTVCGVTESLKIFLMLMVEFDLPALWVFQLFAMQIKYCSFWIY